MAKVAPHVSQPPPWSAIHVDAPPHGRSARENHGDRPERDRLPDMALPRAGSGVWSFDCHGRGVVPAAVARCGVSAPQSPSASIL